MAGEFDRRARYSQGKTKKKPPKPKSVGKISTAYKGPMDSPSSNSSISIKSNSSKSKNAYNPSKAKITPARSSSSSGRRSSGGGGGYRRSSSGGGGGGGGGGAVAKSAPAPVKEETVASAMPEKPKETVPEFDSWLGQDSLYNSQAGAGGTINTELQAYLASLGEQNRQFGQDTEDALRNLGWKEGKPGEDVAGLSNVTARASGAPQGYWDPTDQLGAYGQAQTNARNDFSGRGLMDSSFYQDAVSNLDNSFNRQRSDYLNAQQQQNNAYQRDSGAANDKAEAARRAAKADALARYNSTYNITPKI